MNGVIDATLVGVTAAELMEELPEQGELVAVGLIAIVDIDGDAYTYLRFSERNHFVQLGMMHTALGALTDPGDDDDGDSTSD